MVKSEEARAKRSEYTRVWKRANPERVKIHRQTLYNKKRDFLWRLKSHPCEECGQSYPPCVMDFHHKDPDNKTCEINWGWSEARILREVDKCELLCANCHRIKTWL